MAANIIHMPIKNQEKKKNDVDSLDEMIKKCKARESPKKRVALILALPLAYRLILRQAKYSCTLCFRVK
jgi:hypothetical protein